MFTPQARQARSGLAWAASLVLHVVAAAGLVVIARIGPTVSPDVQDRLTFVNKVVAIPVVPAPPPEPMVLPKLPEPAPVQPKVDVPELPPAPKPPTPEPEAAPKPVPAPRPVPPAPVIKTGVFEDAAPAKAAAAPKPLQPAGFDVAAARANDARSAPVAAGFDTSTNAVSRTNRAVTSGGFDSEASASARVARVTSDAGFGVTATDARTRQSTSVRDSGFGSGAAAGSIGAAKQIAASNFDAQPAAPASQPARAAPRPDTAVEILSKPSPAYTQEARDLKIEGDVTLDVEFTAAGTVKVLSIVRGLGHGLDEMAAKAAEGIRFTPAKAAGQPVTSRATIRIVFRLI